LVKHRTSIRFSRPVSQHAVVLHRVLHTHRHAAQTRRGLSNVLDQNLVKSIQGGVEPPLPALVAASAVVADTIKAQPPNPNSHSNQASFSYLSWFVHGCGPQQFNDAVPPDDDGPLTPLYTNLPPQPTSTVPDMISDVSSELPQPAAASNFLAPTSLSNTGLTHRGTPRQRSRSRSERSDSSPTPLVSSSGATPPPAWMFHGSSNVVDSRSAIRGLVNHIPE